MMYTIIDIETTGKTNRITEISIHKFDGENVIDEFTSLVNPQYNIPIHITALTGIDNEMVADAPLFSEVAQNILSITKDSVFVAHNINFDYNIVRSEFKKIGVNFKRKKLCTVRLSRKLLSGHRSYSLGKLCKDLNIEITDRHRAYGDAQATVSLFQHLLKQPEGLDVMEAFMKVNSREATLPANLPKEVFLELPEAHGIYIFKNKKNEIIYVGKAINIKKRVLSHFYSKTKKSQDIIRETAHIDFELSGSELVALLMEDFYIKKHFPFYNKKSKKRITGQSLVMYTDRNNIKRLGINTMSLVKEAIITFYNTKDARPYLEYLCKQFHLCPKYCGLITTTCQTSIYTCCEGICEGKESPAIYNRKIQKAITHINENLHNTVIKQQGRNMEETAFVLIKNGIYLGYGFIDNQEQVTHNDALENYIIAQKDNSDVQQILRSYLLK